MFSDLDPLLHSQVRLAIMSLLISVRTRFVHNDGEKYLKCEGAIASLSFGAARRFCFKHKRTKEKVE